MKNFYLSCKNKQHKNKGDKLKHPSKNKQKKDKQQEVEKDLFQFDEEIVIGMTTPKQNKERKNNKQKTKKK